MPHITFKNVNTPMLEKFITEKTQLLAEVIECPSDWITFYDTQATAYIDGKVNELTCFVKVEWFKRPDKTKDEVATIITEALKGLGKEEVIVQFIEIQPTNYYENLERFLD
ncbi:DUF1904 family protein [Mycoplasma sp. P36-A1]|uniref:DUF1904 family protein n=1 Tax=Mycoplasma sp. P36-A1 TaxID=3252900 RepID=UPI003C2B03AD